MSGITAEKLFEASDRAADANNKPLADAYWNRAVRVAAMARTLAETTR
jgi:hypothetical protein